MDYFVRLLSPAFSVEVAALSNRRKVMLPTVHAAIQTPKFQLKKSPRAIITNGEAAADNSNDLATHGPTCGVSAL